MIRLAIKKIINNKALMLSMFIGMLVAIIIACSVPMYSQGISHRMLVTQLQNYQDENQRSPGAVIISCSITSFKLYIDPDTIKNDSDVNVLNYNYCTDYLNNDLYPKMNMPALVKSVTVSTSLLKAEDIRDKKQQTLNDVVVKATDNYDNAVEIISGRMPSNKVDEDGCIEVMISTATMQNTRYAEGSIIKVGKTKDAVISEYSKDILKLKIVGVFEYKEEPLSTMIDQDEGKEFYCDFSCFYDEVFVKMDMASKATWYFAGDYTKFDLDNIEETIAALDSLNNNIQIWGLSGNATTIVPPIDQYLTYNDNVRSVNVLLVLFYAPVIILAAFFIFMISKFVVENDKNEIAMLNSRGASRKQIVLLYFLQGGTIAIFSLILAPLFSSLICNLLGTTSGFLEFSQRAPMKIQFSISAFLFCAIATVLSLLTMLIPVYRASKIEIVQHKRRKANVNNILSTVVLSVLAGVSALIAAYAYYVLVVQHDGLFTSAGNVQPLAYLFIICSFLAIALAFVLLYPLVLKLLIKLFGKMCSAGLFSAFSRIAKMETREKFIVIFLTVTVAIGSFASVSARTLNVNLDNSTNYKYPCDLMADVKFYVADGYDQIDRQFLFDNIEGIEATKIVRCNDPLISTISGNRISGDSVSLMGIEPDEFGNIVDWDNDILPYDMDYYMSLLKENPEGCILSANAAKALGDLSVGDRVTLRTDASSRTQPVIGSVVVAIVDAWPAYFPTEKDANGNTVDNYLIILNENNLELKVPNLPYSVWMNTNYSAYDVRRMTIKLSAERHLSARLENIVNGARKKYLSQINSVRQATNGSLTLGFVLTIFVCAVGFVIYWMISIKSRTLQIGTMRALGMSFKDIFMMIIWEQVLLCVAAVIIGLLSGIISGIMFGPLLQSAFGTMGDMPPYAISLNVIDMLKLLLLIILLLVVSVGTGIIMLRRIKASAAIKLGEE